MRFYSCHELIQYERDYPDDLNNFIERAFNRDTPDFKTYEKMYYFKDTSYVHTLDDEWFHKHLCITEKQPYVCCECDNQLEVVFLDSTNKEFQILILEDLRNKLKKIFRTEMRIQKMEY